MREAMTEVDLQRMIGAIAAREPRPGIRDRRIGARRCRRNEWNVIRARWNGHVGQSSWESVWEVRGAGSHGTDHGKRLVGVDAHDFVISAGADVTDGQRGVGGKLML